MTTDFDASDYERPGRAQGPQAELDALTAQVRAFCTATGIEPAELIWNGPRVGQALGVLMRGELEREAAYLEREAANMRHRAGILEGAAAQLRAMLAHREREATLPTTRPSQETKP